MAVPQCCVAAGTSAAAPAVAAVAVLMLQNNRSFAVRTSSKHMQKTNTPASHQHHTSITPASHQHHISITPASHQHHTSITPASHQHHTSITPALLCGVAAASASCMYHGCVPFKAAKVVMMFQSCLWWHLQHACHCSYNKNSTTQLKLDAHQLVPAAPCAAFNKCINPHA
jgi:hypothetical protein